MQIQQRRLSFSISRLVCERHLYHPTECSDIDKEHEVQKNGGDATSVLVI